MTLSSALVLSCGCREKAAVSVGQSADLQSLMRDQPDHALVRKLEGSVLASDAPNGFRLSRQAGWRADWQALQIESELMATGGTAAVSAEVPIVALKFRLRAPKAGPPYERLTYCDGNWYGSTYWTGPNWTRVGKTWQHPGEDTPSVRCFHVPRDGRVTVSGRVYKLHKYGDGVRLSIRHHDREVWRAEIDGADGQGVEPQAVLEVRQGDALRFILHKRGTIECDTTFWDPIVTYAEGPRFRASEGFSTSKQGEGGWFYEMLTEDMPAALHATLVSMGAEGLLRAQTVIPGKPVTMTHREALPVFVVADGTNRSGLVLAFDSAGPWSLQSLVDSDGLLRLTVVAGVGDREQRFPPGASIKLPAALLAAYQGPWTASFPVLRRFLDSAEHRAGSAAFVTTVQAALRTAADTVEKTPELDLLLMAQAEWLRDDQITGTAGSFRTAATNHLARARQLLADLQPNVPGSSLDRQAARLEALARTFQRGDLNQDQWRGLYLRTRLLKREIALKNPLLDFRQLLFCKRRPPTYSHLVGQYFGWRQQPGGGLFVLSDPGYSLRARELVGSQLPPGSYLEPRLSYDGQRVVFSFVACPEQPLDCASLPVNERGPENAYFHLYEIHTDGTGLRQLTRGKYDDLMPAYLPDGGIAFCSTRRRSYSRCFHVKFSDRWHSYTLFRVNGDDGALSPLSFNDVNEWFPAVANDGRLLFARWDYIDRDAVTHQNLWAMRPDGTHPGAVWGNAAPKPHCAFQAKPIPGSRKIVFIASAHHAITAGPVCLLDPSVDNNSRLEAVTRLTPGPYPEAESWDIPDYYESPWPLSEKYFLVAYSPERLRFESPHQENPNPGNALGVYLLDGAGNRELIYRDPHISSTTPIPLKAQPQPPVLASALPQNPPPTGTMFLQDVYQGLGAVPRGTIKELRVIQIFPKTTRDANNPRIGFAGEENARAILGTVPVELDGSARFLIPAQKPLLFQALDENGFAYQTMRSTTSVQPGETVACVGCHENRMRSVPAQRILALQRPPSEIRPGEFEGEPFSFVRVVQPVFDRHCLECHGGKKTEKGLDLTGTVQQGFTKSYWALCGQPGDFDYDKTNPTNAAAQWVPRFGQRNQVQVTPPGGRYGARGSRLIKLLRDGHEGVKLSDRELRRLAAWIDCNAIFYGAYDPKEQARQLAGKAIGMPAIQ